MLRFYFVPLIALLLGLIVGLAPSLVPMSKKKQAATPNDGPRVEIPVRSEARPSQLVNLEKAIEKNISKLTMEINASGRKKDDVGYYFRAENYLAIGKYHEAFKDLELMPNLAPHVKQLLRARLYNGLKLYDQALNEVSGETYPLPARAYAFLKKRDFAKAIDECNRCLQAAQSDGSFVEMCYLIRGQAYEALGQHKQATGDFTKALFKSANGYTFAEYLAGEWYDCNAELRMLHNAEVLHRRACSFAALGKGKQAAADRKQADELGYCAQFDACLSSSAFPTKCNGAAEPKPAAP